MTPFGKAILQRVLLSLGIALLLGITMVQVPR